MSQNNRTELPSVKPSPEIEKVVDNTVAIGRVWVNHGIRMGSQALESATETLRLASDALDQVKVRIDRGV